MELPWLDDLDGHVLNDSICGNLAEHIQLPDIPWVYLHQKDSEKPVPGPRLLAEIQEVGKHFVSHVFKGKHADVAWDLASLVYFLNLFGYRPSQIWRFFYSNLPKRVCLRNFSGASGNFLGFLSGKFTQEEIPGFPEVLGVVSTGIVDTCWDWRPLGH